MGNKNHLKNDVDKNKLPITDSTGRLPSDEFFVHQRERIWNAAHSEAVCTSRVKSIHRARLRYAAVFIPVLIGSIAFFVMPKETFSCTTFHCLWERTNKNDIHLTDSELDQWLNDDQLYFELTESF
jgi:hypothetical protein